MHLNGKKIELIAFDIGKTIYDKECMTCISVETYNAIEKLKANKIKVGVCTMRTIDECKSLIKTDLDFYVCLNGTAIYCDDELIFDKEIELEKGTDYYLAYDKSNLYYSSKNAKKHFEKVGFNSYIKSNQTRANVFVLHSKDFRKTNITRDYNIEVWGKSDCITLQEANTSKASAIELVMDYYNIKSSPIYFGDAPNDLCVFKKYHTCIAMGNCYTELIDCALFQTDTCINNGFSKAIDKILMKNQ